MGINSVLEALQAHRKIKVIRIARNQSDRRLQQILQLAEDRGIKVIRDDKKVLDRMASYGIHQGILAEAEPYRYYSLEDILNLAAEQGEEPLFLLLDGIEDPQNLGAIIRTAEGLGAHGVVIPKHGACPVTPAVTRASAGASEHLKVAMVTNLVSAMKELKERGIWIVGTDSRAAVSCYDIAYPTDIALVVGGEGKGIRRLVKENCDYMVSIPMRGRVNSLNASVSAAIVLAEVVRQRRAAASDNG
ncbi:MAG: 23S rRNA (guanosine(2251)-2'-O)-methyltransferase RlmB [Syntrophomonadales bacterium]